MTKDTNSGKRNNSKGKHVANRSKIKPDVAADRNESSAATGKNGKSQNNKSEKKASNNNSNGASSGNTANIGTDSMSSNSSAISGGNGLINCKEGSANWKEANHGNPEFVFKEPKNGGKPIMVSRGIQTANVTQVQLRYLFGDPVAFHNGGNAETTASANSSATNSDDEMSSSSSSAADDSSVSSMGSQSDYAIHNCHTSKNSTQHWPSKSTILAQKLENLVLSCKRFTLHNENQSHLVSGWQSVPMCCSQSLNTINKQKQLYGIRLFDTPPDDL
ncbi:HHR052Cp [Eremothecium sinecaudum]|uniref:HHR052Cp n=1 Tax=Eremothecium sinecaudum TaxID=45286 RepID=A0A0X8HWJ9_9SACH|nr:HHR052Cp [Eremothecium sinecaudum]AMD22821.1 HHR052Cp [Eremothecium sinecaudum]